MLYGQHTRCRCPNAARHNLKQRFTIWTCWVSRLFRRTSKKISNLRVTGLCEGNLPVTRGFPSQRVPVTRKMLSFDGASMNSLLHQYIPQYYIYSNLLLGNNDRWHMNAYYQQLVFWIKKSSIRHCVITLTSSQHRCVSQCMEEMTPVIKCQRRI